MARRIVDGKHFCCRCKQWKTVDNFYRNKISYTGLEGRCKQCNIERQNQYHTDSLSVALRSLAQGNRTNGKCGSKRRQEFSVNSCVTRDFLRKLWDSQDGKCAVTGVSMTHIQGSGHKVWTNVTVDRICPNVGYIESNVRLVCRAVNYAKNAMTDKEMVEWAKAIVNGPVAQRLSDAESSEPAEGNPCSPGEV